MSTLTHCKNHSVTYNQIVNLVKTLSYTEKLKLAEVIRKETKVKKIFDKIETHITSEKVLAKDWDLPQEDEAWKDL